MLLFAGILSLFQLGLPRQAEAGVVKNIVLYLPNRVFDLVDILRFRVRVGPGFSGGVRVTEAADLFAGAHATAYVGLRGARGEAEIPWPAGLETAAGAELSIADASGGTDRYVDPLEIGLEGQLALIGLYAGIETFEIVDLVAGFFFVDLGDDDF